MAESKPTGAAAELLALRGKIESLRKERDRAAGALDQVLARILKEFGCGTLAKAKVKSAELSAEAERCEAAAVKALRKFKAQYGDQL